MNNPGQQSFHRLMKNLSILSISLAVLGLVSCTGYQQQGALIGGLAGAGLGAAFGDDHQDVIAGAAVGAGVGEAGAAVHEDAVRRRNANQYGAPPPQSYGQPRNQSPPPRSQDYPTAQRTTTPGEVLSPYPPHNRINVEGFRSGSLAKDPETGQIFRVP